MFVDKFTSDNLATAMQSSTMGTDPNMRNRPALVPNELKTCIASRSPHNQLNTLLVAVLLQPLMQLKEGG